MSNYCELQDLEDLERPVKRRRMSCGLDQTFVEVYHNIILDVLLRCNETLNEEPRNHEVLPDMLTPGPEPLLIKDRFVAEYASYYPAVYWQEIRVSDFENIETPDFETQAPDMDQLLIVDCLAQLEQM